MSHKGPITIAIDARLTNGASGGVQQVLQVLGRSFSELGSESTKRFWLVLRNNHDWLIDYIPKGDELIIVGNLFDSIVLKIATTFPSLVTRLRPSLEKFFPTLTGLGNFDQLFAQLKIDVVHLPFQDALKTSFPFLYHPHDLQHLHLPDLFTETQFEHRETSWKAKAQKARFVLAASEWVREDLIKHWGILGSKIEVIKLPPLNLLSSGADEIQRPKWNPPTVFYPANFFKHKNHANLLRAFQLLLQDFPDARLVFSGSPSGNFEEIVKLAEFLGVREAVDFLGYVNQSRMWEQYLKSDIVCIPTLFEAASFPIYEAFSAGVPVAVSKVTSLPEQAKEAALYFDPKNVTEIYLKLRELSTNSLKRAEIIQNGYKIIKALSFSETGRKFEKLYTDAATSSLF